MVDIVLVKPEIPQNTGNIIRLAANTGSTLHLIEPLGFQLEDKRMRRAGLDYHEFAAITVHTGWRNFKENIEEHRNLLGFSTRGSEPYSAINFEANDLIVFGSETRGLPNHIRKDIGQENTYRIPMKPDSRSLNLLSLIHI